MWLNPFIKMLGAMLAISRIDVPIVLAISLAFIDSVYAVLSDDGEVYFEFIARQRSASAAEGLVPTMAIRLRNKQE